MIDQEQAVRLTEDLLAMPTLSFELSGPDAFALVGQLQLALRHPGNDGHPAAFARHFIGQIESACPPRVRQVIAMGYSRAFDVRGSET